MPLPALSDRRVSCVPLSPFCLSPVWAWGGACSVRRAVMLCSRAYRSSLVPSCRSAACLLAFLVSVFGEVGVPRLVARCGRLIACPAVAVAVNRCGWRGVVACRPLLAWVRLAGSVWIMWSVLFSVDYFGTVGYIISRALMLLSPFFVSWHVLVARAALLVLLPQSLSSNAPMNWFLRGTGGSDFFLSIFISSHLSATCLLAGLLFFCYSPTIISISPRSSPRYHRHDRRGGSWLRYD